MRKYTDSSTTNQGQAEELLFCLPLICGGTIINLTLTQMFHKSYTSNKKGDDWTWIANCRLA